MKYGFLLPIGTLLMGGTIATMGYLIDDAEFSISVMGIGFIVVVISGMWIDLKEEK